MRASSIRLVNTDARTDGGSERLRAPKVSVVIPTYNRAALARRAVESALRQTLRDLEVVVVDDASSDDTERQILELGDSRIRFIRHAVNAGACAARNTGIEAAEGTYVAFLDSDDEWLPEKLERQLAVLEKDSVNTLSLVTCGQREVQEDGAPTRNWVPRIRGQIFEDLLAQRKIGCRTSSLLVPASVLRDHGIRFDLSLPARQDWDFVAQLARVGELEIVPDPLVVVHHHRGERVWTPRRAIEAGTYLHDKYATDLGLRPRAHALFHLRTALSCLAAGESGAARDQVRQAIRARRFAVLPYLWLVLTFLGRPRRLSLLQRIGIRLLRPVTFS